MKSIPRPHGILFDVGNTILREDHYDLTAGLSCLEPLSDPQQLGAQLEAEIDRIQKQSTAEFSLKHWLAENRASFARAGSTTELERLVWSGGVKLSPMPGVSDSLTRLAQQGLALGCISNAVFSDSLLQSELERNDLSQHLKFVLSSATFGARKPDARIYSQGLTMLGLEESSVWFVGDSWQADIQGAATVGLFPVWLSDASPPDTVIRYAQVTSWLELCSMITRAVAT